MAQDFAPLHRSIWSDSDFRDLTMDAQHVYLMLMSNPDRNSAGVLSLTVKKWTRLSVDMTASRLNAALTELDNASFIVMDENTEELLVRAFIRRAGVYKHVRMLANALREVSEVESPRLQSALGQELMRLPKVSIPENNERMAAEARQAQDRLNELASMFCDAPPEPPGERAGQDAAHPMAHGMAHPMAHPPVVVAGAVAGAGAVAHPVPKSSSFSSDSSESNAHAKPDLTLIANCFEHPGQLRRSCRSCRSERIARPEAS